MLQLQALRNRDESGQITIATTSVEEELASNALSIYPTIRQSTADFLMPLSISPKNVTLHVLGWTFLPMHALQHVRVRTIPAEWTQH